MAPILSALAIVFTGSPPPEYRRFTEREYNVGGSSGAGLYCMCGTYAPALGIYRVKLDLNRVFSTIRYGLRWI